MAIRKQGKGTTINFTATAGGGTFVGYTFQDVQNSDMSTEMIEATAMDSTAIEKVGSCLVDYGTVTTTLYHDPELDITDILHQEGTLTIESPITLSTNTTKEKETGLAFLSSYSKGRPVKGLMTANITWTWQGAVTITPESV